MTQFSLRVAADHDADLAERFALDLRAELDDLDRVSVRSVPAGPAPDGTRGLELLAVFAFVITAVQAGEAVGRVVTAIKKVQERYAKRKEKVQVTVDGVDVSAGADVEALVRRLLRVAPAPGGVRRALVVANATYDDPGLARLRAPAHDADALAGVLGDPAIGGFSVERLIDADERTIRRRLAAFFTDREPDDLLLLHFSCHGIKDSRGRLHLAARDTDLAALGATSVPAGFVHDVLDETRSRRVVLILDCCYSGAFPRGSLVRSGNEVSIAEEFGGGSGRVVLTASSATEYAFEGSELTASDGQPSVFTSALVRGLSSGEADLDLDGDIGIDELYDYTYREVRASTPGQAPMKWSFGVEGSLTVARSVRPAALPSVVTADLASDRVVLRLEAVAALTDLLSGNPGRRAAALDALARVRDTDDSARVRAAAAAALASADVAGGGSAVPHQTASGSASGSASALAGERRPAAAPAGAGAAGAGSGSASGLAGGGRSTAAPADSGGAASAASGGAGSAGTAGAGSGSASGSASALAGGGRTTSAPADSGVAGAGSGPAGGDRPTAAPAGSGGAAPTASGGATGAGSGSASGTASGPTAGDPPTVPAARKAPETANGSASGPASGPTAGDPPTVPAARIAPETANASASASASGRAADADRPATPTSSDRGLLFAVALLTVASVFVYYLGYQVVDQRPLSEAWIHELAYPVQLGLAAALLLTRHLRYAALLAGLLAWEWMNIAITLHSQAREALPEEWAILVIAAVAAVAAQLCAFAAMWRRRTPIPDDERPLTIATAGVSAVLAAAAPLAVVAAIILYYYIDQSEGGVFRTVTALICAAIIPVTVLLRPPDRLDAWVAVGWLVGGAALATSLTVHFVSDDRNADLTSTVATWILAALTTAIVVAASIRRGRRQTV